MRKGPLQLSIVALGALLASPSGAAGFAVQSVFPFGPSHVAVAFSDSVDVASALRASGYTLSPQAGAPALAIQSVQLQDNQRTVVLATTSSLPSTAAYSLTVTGVKSRHGDPLATANPAVFRTPDVAITGIADVHANVNSLIGQVVTVIGQVYIREGSVTGAPSGYIQDGTGRGLNVFGGSLIPALDTLGTVVQVTGTVALYFTTVEMTGLTVTTLASSVPRLAPRVLTAQAASSAQWEGTYIQVTATLTSAPTVSGSNHYNYAASAGGTPFTFRVRNSLGVDPSAFAAGDVVTGAGAGAVFQSVYQATAGAVGDFFKGSGVGDITPPVLVSVAGEGGDNHAVVTFSEPVEQGATSPSSYLLHPTGSPSSSIPITSATVTGTVVTLALGTPLVAATAYTLEVSGVRDASGNEIPAGSAIDFTAATPVPYRVAGVFRFGAASIGVGFTKPVNASAALDLSHYRFTPALALAAARVQGNGRTVILRAEAALAPGASWSVAVENVPSATGETLEPVSPATLEAGTDVVTDIADLQQNVGSWSGQTVTICGQVTIPVGSRGGTPSGYLEDGSGRGVNLYGGAIQGAVNQLGNVARVTGIVTPYFTTTEITSYTASALATGMPHLAARRVTVAEANDVAWEGTYIETRATLTAITPSGTSSTNYDATDGIHAITFRTGNGLGIPSGQFVVGDQVIGRGAGGSFQSTYQIHIGNLQDLFLAGAAGPDTTGPVPVSATGDDGVDRVSLAFDEPVASAGATLASNYTVTAIGGAAIPVIQVVMAAGGRAVTLTLAAPLVGGTRYAVAIANIADIAGNLCAPGTRVEFTATVAAPPSAQLRVPARTLVRGLSRQGELLQLEAAGVPDSKVTLRIFDLRGRLTRVVFEGRLPASGRRTFTWDGRDDSFELVPAGLYVGHLLATHPSGATSESRAPIVVAVRLQ